MSRTDTLRKTHTKFGGGKKIFNKDALIHEIKLYDAVLEIKKNIELEYPSFNFSWRKRIYKDEIGLKVNPKSTYTPQSKSFVSPDGGVLFIEINGKEYPILISEAKKQGTNTDRLKEGLKKQSKGNAIERVYKNIEEFKLFCSDIDYFPYVVFACGCDFEVGSSILDRLDAMTKYEPRNVDYTLDSDKKSTIYVKGQYFTYQEIYDILYSIVIKIVKRVVGDE